MSARQPSSRMPGLADRTEHTRFIYSIQDGLLRDLHMSANSNEELQACYKVALEKVEERVRDRVGEC